MTNWIEPERTVIKRADIPQKPRHTADKYFWDSVMSHLKILEPDEALLLNFECAVLPRVTSSAHEAAARNGLRISTAMHSAMSISISLTGTCKPLVTTTTRKPIQCRVCGRTIIRPKTGGSRQYVCANGKSKTYCQNVLTKSRRYGISVEEYIRTRAKIQQPTRSAA